MTYPVSNLITADYPDGKQNFIPSVVPTRLGSVPTRNLIISLGDSLQERGVTLNGAPTYNTGSALNWGLAFLKQALWLPFGCTTGYVSGAANIVNYNVAVSGTTSADVLATQVGPALNKPSGWWSIQVGTNDLTLLSSQSVSQIASRLAQICQLGLSAGQKIALWTIPPRNDNSGAGNWQSFAAAFALSGTTVAIQRAKQMALNNWIRQYAQETPGVVLIDPYSQLVDTASATGDWITGYAVDGVHWGTGGAFIGGRAFFQAMAPFVKVNPVAGNGQTEVYDAVGNPTGNVIAATQAAFIGTGGTVAGVGVSGDLPTGWTNDLEAGTLTPGTAVLATTARNGLFAGGNTANGRQFSVTLAGASPGNYNLRFYPAATALAIPNGVPFYAELDYEVVSSTTGWRGIELAVFFNAGGNAFPVAFAPDSSAGIPASSSYSATIRTPICRSDSGGASTGLLFIRIHGSAASSAVVNVTGIRIVPVDLSVLNSQTI